MSAVANQLRLLPFSSASPSCHLSHTAVRKVSGPVCATNAAVWSRGPRKMLERSQFRAPEVCDSANPYILYDVMQTMRQAQPGHVLESTASYKRFLSLPESLLSKNVPSKHFCFSRGFFLFFFWFSRGFFPQRRLTPRNNHSCSCALCSFYLVRSFSRIFLFRLEKKNDESSGPFAGFSCFVWKKKRRKSRKILFENSTKLRF